eukprot:g6098.t1
MQYKHVDMVPTDWEDWYRLVRALAQRAVDKYGVSFLQGFEVWNEMWGMDFPGNYMKLYNASSAAIKSVDKSLRVGGPATMQLQHVEDFIEAADKIKAPYDFVSTHMYPTDPQCGQGDNWGPDCLPDAVKKAHAFTAKAGVPLYLTEYNVGCCIGYKQHDGPGAAAFAFRTVGELDGVTDVLSWWTFTDIFEEGTAVADHVEFGMNVYGLMTVSGVPKAGWRGFQMLHEHAGTQRLKGVTVTEDATQDSSRIRLQRRNRARGAACTVEKATDLAGFEIGTATAATAEACCDACKAKTGCSFWTWRSSSSSSRSEAGGPTCSLKNSDAGRKSDAGATSGSTVAPPAPPVKPSARISAFATMDAEEGGTTKKASIFLSFWSDTCGNCPGTKEPSRNVTLNARNVPFPLSKVTEYRIDESHANALAAWTAMGSPSKPSADQLASLQKASTVVPTVLANAARMTVELPANSAVVITLE